MHNQIMHAQDFDRTPSLDRDAYDCPYCEAFAQQSHSGASRGRGGPYSTPIQELHVTRCGACSQEHVWWKDQVVVPRGRRGIAANPDTPASVKRIYDEAREVASISPKSAAALLRLALQMLVNDLVEGSDTLDKKIGVLVKRGMSSRVQKAMDTLRIAGNESVHPGTINLDDDSTMLDGLFVLMNVIVDEMVSRSKHIDELYAALPDGPREAIKRRDARTTGA